MQRYGASTLVLDNRFFVSFNPFDVYVTQADVKPGCVLRAANVVQALQGRGLLTDEEVSAFQKGKEGEEEGVGSEVEDLRGRTDDSATDQDKQCGVNSLPFLLLLVTLQVNVCKNGNNTWAYVGDINDKPQLSCVYQSDDAQNEFLEKNPKLGVGEDVYDK